MTERLRRGRYPGYDVMRKRDTLSFNDKTREVIDARLGVDAHPVFFTADEWRTLEAVCDRVIPQPPDRPHVPVACYVDRQLAAGKTKGYRFADMPQPAEAWKRALAALDEAALRAQGRPFSRLPPGDQDALLKQMADGSLAAPALRGMPSRSFWTAHVVHDIVGAYYAHPESWNEIGWAGPASPRGYVRLGLNRRDAWEPKEAASHEDSDTEEKNQRVR